MHAIFSGPGFSFGLKERMSQYLVITACFWLGCTPSPRRSSMPPKPNPLPSRVQGANLRPVGDTRRGYGTRTARYTLERLRELGVNTIGILLDGRMKNGASSEVIGPSSSELIAARQALDEARELGLATILVPHIYINDGTWRGDIKFHSSSDERAWWKSYSEFINTSAELAQASGSSVLSVGVELKSLSDQAQSHQFMARLVTDIRGVYSGQLTYSANWDEAENVLFWDLVDLVGVNGYYPLEPDPEAGAAKVANRLSKLARAAGKEVMVLEVGYRSSPDSHKQPWEWPEQIQPKVDEAAQARAWDAVLKHWLPAHRVRGLIVWVIPTDPDDPASEPKHGFNPLNKQAEYVLRKHFLGSAEHTHPNR